MLGESNVQNISSPCSCDENLEICLGAFVVYVVFCVHVVDVHLAG